MAKLKDNPLYVCWTNIKSRCNNPKFRNYKYWGGKGITYDPKWENFKGFLEDMESSFKIGLTLDRIDNTKDYSKDNCRWATWKEQQNNRSNNKLIKFKGKSLTLTDWSKETKIKRSTLAQRLYVYNWPIDRLLTKV